MSTIANITQSKFCQCVISRNISIAFNIRLKSAFSELQKLTAQILLGLLSFSSPLILCNTSWGQSVPSVNLNTQNQQQSRNSVDVERKTSLEKINTINTALREYYNTRKNSVKKDKIDIFKDSLKDSDKKVRIAALNALGAIGTGADEALGDLKDMLSAERNDPEVLIAVISTIRSINSKPAIPELIDVFKDKQQNSFVRSQAAEALNTAITNPVEEAKELIPFLLDLLEDQSADATNLRISAAIILSQTLHHQAEQYRQDTVPRLTKALKDPDWRVRRYAADALGNMGVHAKDSVPLLIKTIDNPNYTLRRAVVIALGNIGKHNNEAALEILPRLKETLEKDKNPTVRDVAIDTLREVAGNLRTEAQSDKIEREKLNKAKSDLENALEEITPKEKQIHKSDIYHIQSSLEELQRRQVINQILKNPLAWGISSYLILLFGIFWLRPLWLLKIDELLEPLDLKLPIPGGLKISPRPLLFLKNHPRVMDAWVNAYLKSARETFQQRETVAQREVYIPIPVIFDGKTLPQLTPQELHSKFKKHRNCLLIQGEGGVGKTSLACQIAKWAMSENEEERLCKHPMLPVLIEGNLDSQIMPGIQGVNVQASDIQKMQKMGQQPLLAAILGQLKDLSNEPEPISEGLLERLLRYRRILVIVDRFSEMNEETRKIIRPDLPNFPAHALVITSRSSETLNNVTKSTIKPLRIEGNRLSSFMEAYLTKQGKRDLFTDTEFFAACGRLSHMVGNRNITVLLAKLYADQITANRVEEVRDLPLHYLSNNIPELMLWYLNELNRSVTGDNKLSDRTVQQDTKLVAWECLRQSFKPEYIKREVALAAIGGDDAESHLKYLEERLRLIQTIGAGQDQIRFALDPLAEYLAGLHLIDLYSDNKQLWQDFLQQTTTIPGMPETIIDFLLALRDCCLAKRKEIKVLEFVAEQLDKQVNLSPEVSQSIDKRNALTKLNLSQASNGAVGVQTLVEYKICNNCSYNNPSNYQFCCKCGKPLSNTENTGLA
jgi:HEAT repeat protein